jgi:DNA-3-methyladenine glycosylase
MRARRRRSRVARRKKPAPIPEHALCRGPGNLTHAMGITLKDTGLDLLGHKLYIEDRGYTTEQIAWSPRIGIRVGTERPWRCYAEGHLSVSGRSGSGALNSARETP